MTRVSESCLTPCHYLFVRMGTRTYLYVGEISEILKGNRNCDKTLPSICILWGGFNLNWVEIWFWKYSPPPGISPRPCYAISWSIICSWVYIYHVYFIYYISYYLNCYLYLYFFRSWWSWECSTWVSPRFSIRSGSPSPVLPCLVIEWLIAL